MADYAEKIAKVISVLFHPLWIPTYAFIAVVFFGDPLQLRIPVHAIGWLTLLVFIVSGIIPTFLMVIMYRLKLISSLSMSMKDERSLPILLTAVFFYLTYYLLRKLDVAPVFGFYMLGATSLAIVCMFINLWWKVSLHLTAFGGFFGALIGLAILFDSHFIVLAVVVSLMAGLVGYSRLKLAAHQPSQIYAGFILGSSMMYLLFSLFH